MAEVKAGNEVKEYADGWISERKGTDVPKFLKLAYIVIAAGCIAYFLIYMFGEVNHSDRGVLVRQMNQSTQSSSGLMYFVLALLAVCALIVVKFAFSKFHED
jgi:H+/Cl- antiporter ClcA